MNIKELGLEELTVSEKRETKGGVGALAIGLTVAGLFLFCQSLGSGSCGGGGWNGGPVP